MSAIVVIGAGVHHVEKDEWRGARSRADLRASLDPTVVTPDAIDQLTGKGGPLGVILPDGEYKTSRRLGIGPIHMEYRDEAVWLDFVGAVLRGAPARVSRSLGSLEAGNCLEFAVNYRAPSKWSGGGQMLYSDYLWRFHWPMEFRPGAYRFPEPDRVIDLREILY